MIVAAQRLGGFDTVQLAPNLPAKLRRGVIVGPIELGPDELLLGVIDPTLRMQTKRSWAVTTRRVVSCDPRRGNPSVSTAEALKACEDELGPALVDALGQFLGVIRDEDAAESRGDRSLPAPFAEFAGDSCPTWPINRSESAPSTGPCANSARHCGSRRLTPS
jgi:hypothetical protein